MEEIGSFINDENRNEFYQYLFNQFENRQIKLFQIVLNIYKKNDKHELIKELQEDFEKFIFKHRELAEEKGGKMSVKLILDALPENIWSMYYKKFSETGLSEKIFGKTDKFSDQEKEEIKNSILLIKAGTHIN